MPAAAEPPTVLVDPQVTTRTEYVRVPQIDPEGEAYRESARRLVQLYPELTPYMEQLESVKGNLLHGQQIQNR